MKILIKVKILPFFIAVCLTCQPLFAQKYLKERIGDSLTVIATSHTFLKDAKVTVKYIHIDKYEKKIVVVVNNVLAQIPFRQDNVKQVYDMLSKVFASMYPAYKITCQSDGKNIEDLIPNYYRIENIDSQLIYTSGSIEPPLVTNLSRPYTVAAGLQNRHIALWQSHGFYYNQERTQWSWQRAKLLQTVEDLYTQSYVLPFLVPMLQNAGANVLLPRERDTQLNEMIVDNDGKFTAGRYHEHNDRKSWMTVDSGFANLKKTYLQGENPFKMGTYRVIQTIKDNDELSYAQWTPTISEDGYYAVYVSYKTVDKSASDARYIVYHDGGKTEFSVNQTINGGTWLYLGHFKFSERRNKEAKVVLTNYSVFPDKVITADAVKVGGGYGNIARSPGVDTTLVNKNRVVASSRKTSAQDSIKPIVSGYPRFTEGARYWLQWAGAPDSVYSSSGGLNDYVDDYTSRSFWVNYLLGGSSVLPEKDGLGVPLDMAFAFHSNAGTVMKDSIYGTLGIYSVEGFDETEFYKNGISRWASRDLTDIIQTQVVEDIRREYTPDWTRCGMWNKRYSEARTPEIPTMLLELLSHQNFSDMRYGLDPRFRFTVCRAVYKGMLKYLSNNSDVPYVVQPLPVKQFSSKFVGENEVELRWMDVEDAMEPTASPEQYVIYSRIEDGGFDNGVVVDGNLVTLEIVPGVIYSFKIAALNKGGESFPSEVLSVYKAPNQRGGVMIVNGFDRISAPVSFEINDSIGGFDNDKDPGVPYIADMSFIGKQYEFDRTIPWVSDDNPGYGASNNDYETQVIAGNTFDYPYLHGKAIKAAGFSFVSCSDESVTAGDIDLTKYKIVDVILGKQKQTFIGNAKNPAQFKTFPLALQQSLRSYCDSGGSLLVSGAFIGSDFYADGNINSEDSLFAENILKYKFKNIENSLSAGVKVDGLFKRSEFTLYDKPNKAMYYLESADVIEPACDSVKIVCRYEGNDLSAGVAYSGEYKVCSLGFPFESIQSEKERNRFMNSVLDFFTHK